MQNWWQLDLLEDSKESKSPQIPSILCFLCAFANLYLRKASWHCRNEWSHVIYWVWFRPPKLPGGGSNNVHKVNAFLTRVLLSRVCPPVPLWGVLCRRDEQKLKPLVEYFLKRWRWKKELSVQLFSFARHGCIVSTNFCALINKIPGVTFSGNCGANASLLFAWILIRRSLSIISLKICIQRRYIRLDE